MNKRIRLRLGRDLYSQLTRHLFPGDSDEHGAVIAAGVAVTPGEIRLLGRHVFLAQDGRDYVEGTRGYRALTPTFIAEKAGFCADQGLSYLAVHCHPAENQVALSRDDLASQERGYPALLQITKGGPVGGIVFARNAIAGQIWFPGGERRPLDEATIIGPQIRTLYPSPKRWPHDMDPLYDRHARIFGDVGQAIIGGLRVGIIGLGGAGSLLNEWLARLGVGKILGVDRETLDITNIPRVVGSTRDDVGRPKVDIAESVAREANPTIAFEAIHDDIVNEEVALRLRMCDFIFLAADAMQARLVFNALVYQYLIPGCQVGAKVTLDRNNRVAQIFTATRLILPIDGGGCLVCSGLIPPARLQEEALSPAERKAQRYVDSDEVPAPSVITLNALATAQAAHEIVMLFTGLYRGDDALPFLMNFPIERVLRRVDSKPAVCQFCGTHRTAHRAQGDRAELPCR